MTPQAAISFGANALLGAAERLEEAAHDLRAGRGRTRVLAVGLRISSFALGVAAVPVVIADVMVGEFQLAMDSRAALQKLDEDLAQSPSQR